MKEFNEILTHLRKEKRITMEQLAEDLKEYGVTPSKSMISRWENGLADPSMTYVRILSKYFDVSLDYLLGMSDEIRKPPNNHASVKNSKFSETNTNPIAVIKKESIDSITVYGKVCAGDGFEALEDPIDEIGDPYYRIKEEKFALLVDGDSMNNVVANGMYAIIEKRPVVNNGEIAVILIDNEVGMLKRFYQLDDMVILRPDSSNLDHKPLTFIGEEINSLKVLGRYLGCVSPMENLL